MHKKKWLMLTLSTGLALSATACGSSEDKESSTAATASPSTAAAPIVSSGPKPELRALQIWMKDDYNTYPVAKVIEEKTGYKVKYDMLPADKANDKLNLLISSAEPYDSITIGADKALFADYAKKGALTDLGPLIDKYGPNIKASISQESFDAIKVDGKIYAIPFRGVEFSSTSLMVRKDWLDKLGLKMPTTIDEFTAMLKAFKDKDPGGNGDKNAPMTIRGDTPMIEDLVGAFGMPNNWSALDGKLVPRALHPGFKDYLAYVADLYKQGLLDKEFAVNKDATMKEKFTSGKAGVVMLNWADIPTIGDALNKNFPDAKFAYLPILKGKDGKAGLNTNAGFDRLTFIPKASKHPEDAIKWMNAKLEKETFKEIAIGVEGKHHTFKDALYSPILPIFTDERNQANNYLTGVDEKNYPIYWQARVQKDARLFEGWSYLNKVMPAELRIRDPLGLAPTLQTYSKENNQLNQMVNDFAVKIIVGGEPLANVDAFAAKYKAAGGEASYKEINDWYATVKK
jgi:putative aldouronate transport system substrate-binding protein